MTSRIMPKIIIEKISLKRSDDFHETILESGKEWFASGMIPKPNLSAHELECMLRAFLILWEKDDTYMFYILDANIDQVVGVSFLNRMNRMRQFANLGYSVRTSRVNQGIATAAAKLVACYGFQNLGLQRIEIVVCTDNLASLKVAGKLGAVREGLLRNGLRIHGVPCNAFLYSLIPADMGIIKAPGRTESVMEAWHSPPVYFERILEN